MLTTPALKMRWLNAVRGAQDRLTPLIAQRFGWDENALPALTLSGLVISAVTTALEYSLLLGVPLADSLDECVAMLAPGDRAAARPASPQRGPC